MSQKRAGFAVALRPDDDEWIFYALAVQYAMADLDGDDGETLRCLDLWSRHIRNMGPENVERCLARVFRQGRKSLDRLCQEDLFATCSRREVVSDG